MDCEARVGRGIVTFQCSGQQGHPGPHWAVEHEPSMREREQWERQGDDARRTLAQSQGPAQTTAERYTDGAQPHPDLPRGTDARAKMQTDAMPHPPWEDHLDPRFGVAEPTKQRPGDQPLPTTTEDAYVQDGLAQWLLDTLEESKRVGTERYGTPLQPFNGRDAFLDALQEARDLLVYLGQLHQARHAPRERHLAHMVDAWEQAGRPHQAHEVAAVMYDALVGAIGGFAPIEVPVGDEPEGVYAP